MNYEIVTLVIGFVGLAVILNRNTVALTGRMDQLRSDLAGQTEKVRAELRAELAGQIGSLGTELNAFRTGMNRRFDDAGVETNRRFDGLGRDIGALRERMARVEEAGGAGAETRSRSAV